MAEFSANHRVNKFATFMESFSGRLSTALMQALSDVGQAMEATLVKERLSSPSTGNPWLATRTGTLKRATRQWEVTGDKLGNIEYKATIDVPYAKVQEFGTVGAGGELPDIVPTRATYLTIPLDAAKTPAGVAKGDAYEVGSEYDDTYFERKTGPKGDQLILYGVRGDMVVPLFLLVRRVAIPPRLGFFATWKKLEPYRRRRMLQAIKESVER